MSEMKRFEIMVIQPSDVRHVTVLSAADDVQALNVYSVMALSKGLHRDDPDLGLGYLGPFPRLTLRHSGTGVTRVFFAREVG